MTRNRVLRDALRTVLTREGLTHKQAWARRMWTALMAPVTARQLAGGEERPLRGRVLQRLHVLFFLMYFVIMLYGMNVARSIIEEKTSRIFEVLLATIRPEEMMAGKVIGVGFSVGLTQVGIWLTTAVVLTATPLVSQA